MIIYLANILSMPLYAKFVKNKKWYFLIVSLQLFLILALRDVTVGMDLGNYSDGYDLISSMSFTQMLKSLRLVSTAKLVSPYVYESGYVLVNWLFSHLGIPFHGFLVIHAAFCVASYTLFVRRFSKTPWISYVIFIGIGMYTYRFGILRQSIAVSIMLFAFDPMVRRKPKAVFALAAAAFLFHRTSVIVLALYFLCQIKLTKPLLKKLIIGQLVSFAAAPLLFSTVMVWIMNLLGKHNYTKLEFDISQVLLGMLALEILIYFFVDLKRLDTPDGRLMFWGYICAIFVMTFGQCNSAFGRMNEYYQVLLTVFVPYLFSSVFDRRVVKYLEPAVLVVMSGYLMLIIPGTGIVPWSLYLG